MGDCSLHENQRIAGTLCRSMHCTKCPPYRGPTKNQTIAKLKADLALAIEGLEWIGFESHNEYDFLAPGPSASRMKAMHAIGVKRGIRARETLAKLKQGE